MDSELRALLFGAFQFLEQHEKALSQVMIVTFALRKTVAELGPEAEKIYAKHFQAESQGPIRREGDVALQALSQLAQRLVN
jgi:hypothetical protein